MFKGLIFCSFHYHPIYLSFNAKIKTKQQLGNTMTHRSDIDLNLLRVLTAIYTEGNLTKAGMSLGVSQPAVSNALSRLRDYYGDPLFFRSGKRMRPTFFTQKIIPQIEFALGVISATKEETSTKT
jgi:hypothetical protein